MNKYSTMDMSDTELVISEITKLYPDKKMNNFSECYKNFYVNLRSFLQNKNITVGEFCRDNGFEYRVRRNAEEFETLDEFVYELNEIYPDKKVAKFAESHGDLYHRLLYSLQGKDITVGYFEPVNNFV